MANPSKDKGDKGELEAVRAIVALAPDLCVWNAMRMLGAGRKEDVGDLLVFPDAAIQVKAFKKSGLSAAIYSAAAGATAQAEVARHPHALGLVLVPRARLVGSVRWMACMDVWPLDGVEHQQFSNSLAAFDSIKQAGPDSRATAQVKRKDTAPVILSSLQTWVVAYRLATNRPEPLTESIPAEPTGVLA